MFQMNRLLASVFGKLGRLVSGHPLKTIFISVFLVALTSIGYFTSYSIDTRNREMWAPSDSVTRPQADIVDNKFFRTPYTVDIIFYNKNHENVYTLARLADLYALFMKISATTVSAVDANGTQSEFSFQDLCHKPSKLLNLCYFTSPLDVFKYNLTLVTELAASGELASYTAAREKNLVTTLGSALLLDTVVGGIKRGASGQFQSAEVLKLRIFLDRKGAFRGDDGKETHPPAQAFQRKVMDMVNELKLADCTVNAVSNDFFQTESDRSTGGDMGLVVLAISIIIVYVCVQLGRWTLVASRLALSLAAVVQVLMALGVSYGLGSLISPYTAVHPSLSFLLFGIGVDDCFVLVNEFDLTPDIWSVERRLEVSLARAGSALLVTSATNFLAFGIGSLTSFPALSSFCLWAMLAVLGLFLLIVTFFSACMVLDAKRQLALKMDIFCCVHRPNSVVPNTREDPTIIRKFMKNYWGPFISKKSVAIAAVCICVAYAGFSMFALTKLDREFKVKWFLPGDSKLQDYYDINDAAFEDHQPVSVYFLNYDPFSASGAFVSARKALNSNSWIDQKYPKVDWQLAFLQWLSTQSGSSISNGYPVSSDAYNALLKQFLALPAFSRFGSDVIFGEANTVEVSRIHATLVVLHDSDDCIDAWKSTTSAVRNEMKGSGVEEFVYNPWFGFYDHLDIIIPETVKNASLAVIAVFLCVWILLANTKISFILLLGMCFVVLSVLGTMWLYGVYLDVVSCVCCVIGVGLCVDYSVHVAACFSHTPGSGRADRVQQTMEQVGVSVLNGALSTFLAVLALSLSKSYIFTTFYRMLFLTVVFGILNALVLVPAVLVLVGPKASAQAGEGCRIEPDTVSGDGVEMVQVKT